jgi:peptidoglycan hydrolase-like protein with peptidoglycan-binding domain
VPTKIAVSVPKIITPISGTLTKPLYPGITNAQVAILQQYLINKGYLKLNKTTSFYGPSTFAAVVKYQIDNHIITSKRDSSAGAVGPKMRKIINSDMQTAMR